MSKLINTSLGKSKFIVEHGAYFKDQDLISVPQEQQMGFILEK